MSGATALLVIDVQMGMFDGRRISPVPGGELLLERIGRLIARARSAKVPVIYVQHCGDHGHPLEPGTPGWKIHHAIAPGPGDMVVQKATPDSFHETDLQDKLEALGVKKLVVAGLQTEYCIDTTCRRAFSLGYDVTLAGDGHGTWSTKLLNADQIISHHNSVLGNWFVTLRSADEIEFAGG